MRLSEAASLLHGELSGPDIAFTGLEIDTRRVRPGSLFVALAGARAHGHAYLEEAAARGAAAALVEGPVPAELPLVRVSDTRLALAALASEWRRRYAGVVVGVTGSNGKTTVKEMLRHVLAAGGEVLATQGNLNNELGVPLTLTALGATHRYAVVEMGANHPGEIAALTSLARPAVGIVTQCAPAHLEGFGSVEGVARAKGELFAGLPEDGVAVVNRDDPYAELWDELAGTRRVLGFGLEAPAEVTARVTAETDGSRMTLRTPGGEASLYLAMPGRHNVMNALAAAAVAVALGMDPEVIARGLACVRALPGRLEVLNGSGGSGLIDDTYNANPGSLEAALAVLRARPGRHWLVLGDMRELGPRGPALHAEAGRAARAAGVERLFALGELGRAAAQGFGRGALCFADPESLLEALEGRLAADLTVLVKGSRAMGMERIVRALQREARACC